MLLLQSSHIPQGQDWNGGKTKLDKNKKYAYRLFKIQGHSLCILK